jgi:hypothetical protein
MSRLRKVAAVTGLAVLFFFAAFGCSFLLKNDLNTGEQTGWYIKLNVHRPPPSKAIAVSEYDVTGLTIEVRDPDDELIQTIQWEAEQGSTSYAIPVTQQGQHRILVTHIGTKNGQVVEAEESATFYIEAMVITVIDIIPGRIGVIKVESGGEELPPTLVAIGDSITMGIQDAGLIKSFQENCYPYFLALQMGASGVFQQPLVHTPGTGVPPYETPLLLTNGQIIPDYLDPAITPAQLMLLVFSKLDNAYYSEPYNNLGVNGARLYDLRHTTGYNHSYYNDPNFFFDIVLRNLEFGHVPNFGGKTVVEEAVMRDPKYILLWIGNNDVLGYILGGGEDPSRITSLGDFEAEYRSVLQDLMTLTEADIVLANIPEYLPFGYALDSVFVAGNPKLFNPNTLQPIDFDIGPGEEYVDLYILPENEGEVKHLLLTAAAAYIEKGLGLPSGLTDAQKNTLVALGLTVPASPLPLTNDLVLTDTEEQASLEAITAFNQKIATLAVEFGLPVVNMNSWMKPGGSLPDSYFKFVLVAQNDTMYSLDGVHPNNFGHALCANAFIKALNQSYDLNLAELNPSLYKGQYSGKSIQSGSLKAVKRVIEMYAPQQP